MKPRVAATKRITEAGFLGKREHVHALVGDRGTVQAVDGAWATVTWDRTGTTTDCHTSEFRPSSLGHN